MPVVLITGAARRLGKIIIEDFLAKGWDVAFTCNNSLENAKQIVKLAPNGCRIKFYQGDFRDSSFTRNLIPRVKFDFQNIDLLINNASIFERCSFSELTEDALDDNFSIHVKTPLILAQSMAKYDHEAKIINITDVMVSKNATAFFPYILTKKSLSELTKMLAKNLAPKIQVNEIRPGMMLADLIEANSSDNKAREHKLPAMQKPDIEDLLKAIDYFINNNCYGQSLYVDSGEHIL